MTSPRGRWGGRLLVGLLLLVSVCVTVLATLFVQRSVFVSDDLARGERFAESLRPVWAADADGERWKQSITDECASAAASFYGQELGRSTTPPSEKAFYAGCSGDPITD